MSERPTFRTQLCDMLEIEYPIMLAGMGSMGKATPPALVAAVSNAGGMGVIGGAGLERDHPPENPRDAGTDGQADRRRPPAARQSGHQCGTDAHGPSPAD